jgi:HEAT repeat protein
MRYCLVLACLSLPAFPGLAADPARKPNRVAGLTAQLSSPNPDVRRQAAVALGNLGLAGRTAAPALARALHDREGEIRKSAARALGQIGKPAIPSLLEALEDRDEDVRARAARAMGQMGPDARAAIPALLLHSKDSARPVRLAAIGALGEMGPEAKPAVAPLVRLLRDRSTQVRERAAVALVLIGSDALAPLCDALTNGREPDRVGVIRTIALFGAEAKAAVPALRTAMKDDDFHIRAAAAEALGNMEADAQDAVPELLDALHDKKREVHDKAANALIIMTVAGVPGLLEKVRKAENRDRWLAPVIEAQQVARAVDPLTRWLDGLKDKDAQVRARAALVLGSMGPQAQRAVPALKRAAVDEDAQVRLAVAMALAHIQRNKAEKELAVQRAMRTMQRMQEAMVVEARTRFLAQGGVFLPPPQLNNPLVQMQMNQFIMMYITLKASARNSDDTRELDKIIDHLGVEAVPALVAGINYVGTYQVGDC